MTRLSPALCLLLLCACKSGKIPFDEVEDAGDVEDLCDDFEDAIETDTVELIFPAMTEPCPWGEDDNGTPTKALISARVEQSVSLDLDDVVLCDIDMDMTGLVPDEVQLMEFDDHFFFTFNDIVMASSNEPLVSNLPTDDGMPVYEWESVFGQPYDNYAAPYCLGEEDGDADCEIPQTHTTGPISLDFGEDVITELSVRAFDDDRYDYGFVVTGDDNADSDCRHAEFGFTVEVEYLEED